MHVLYARGPRHGAALLEALFPRAYIDPNRAAGDVDLELIDGPWPDAYTPSGKSRIGKSLIWRLVGEGQPIYDRKLSVDEVVRIHSATVFHIYMLGFLPGFPYMGDLPEALHLPRRQSPRLRVPQGAVSIAMSMSCIYVLESPGGWHVLSNTPAFLWDPRRENAGLLAAGDKVQFHPIPLPEYQALRGRAERGEWAPEPVASGASA